MKARLEALEDALRQLHIERLDHDDDQCPECGSHTNCEDGLEPTPECHLCAHVVLERVRIAVRKAIAYRDAKLWWCWPAASPLAHARTPGTRGRAVCGGPIHVKACLATGNEPRCAACEAALKNGESR